MTKKSSRRERTIFAIGLVAGFAVAVSMHVAEAGAAIEQRPDRYQSSLFQDPMAPPSYRAPSAENSVDLSSWRVNGAMINERQSLIMINNTLVSQGDHYEGQLIQKIELSQITVKTTEDKIVVIPVLSSVVGFEAE